ncbi:hypothetical protein MA16_Dca015474 [Dendrobium catenatum]|uniref:H/ACA ribonucleoprotein complex non-core subunit NAF1 n=1 Tax=Dendrobium catenatum TaxID=906689 RepID=A0A2I0X9N4_9ASPA|nr:hypothetical protein MA16_Dca015474 [Dendrobium catenatum]
MYRCWSPVYVEEENHLSYDDFDPLKEWLAHPDHVQLQNSSDLSNTSLDPHELHYSEVKIEQKDQILESSIDVKMGKINLVEISDRGQVEVGFEENRGGSDGDMKCMKPGLEDLKNDIPNKEGIFGGESDEEGSTSVEAESGSGDSSSDESMSVAKSLSSSEDEDDIRMKRKEEGEESEEGEVREFDGDKIDFLSDEETEGPKGPIRSKHEVEDLPPVPIVEVSIQPHHQMLPVGIISSIISNRVIVEGSVVHNPLNEGSILWVTETRLPLGLVDEIFGPVKNPYYVVRYNTEEDVPAGIRVAMAISFVGEFASHILNDKDLYKKGYDASGDNDEEVDNEVEFSDDEKEQEYKKSQREGKRVINHSKGLKQEARFERKRNAFVRPRTQHKDIQKQTTYAPLSKDQPHPTGPAPPPPAPLCPRAWTPVATNADSIPPSAMPQFPQAIQANNFLANPSQQLLSQHQDPQWLPGFSPQLQNTGFQGDLSIQLQNQNVIFNNLVNMMTFQQLVQQFVPHQGSNLQWAGAAAPSLQPLGQNNFAPLPFSNGYINGPGVPGLGNEQIQSQAPLPFAPSMQFNSASPPSLQFNGGNSWSRGRRPYQRGRGRVFDRGGRQPNR